MTDFGANWFDRVWNSTLGLPQQYLYRLLRVAQGDADLFSERGLLDKSLVPVVGIADDHTQDVSPREMAQRTRKVLQGVGVDIGQGVAQDMSVAILTDPLTFAGSALMAPARLGRLMGKASNVIDPAVRSGILAESKNIKEAIPALREAIKSGNVPPKFVNKALRRLEAAELEANKSGLLGKSWDDIQAAVGNREAVMALPFGLAQNRLSIRVSQQHRGWFSLMGEPFKEGTMVNRAFGTAYNGVAGRNIPILSESFREIRGFGTGLNRGWTRGAQTAVRVTGGEQTQLIQKRGGFEQVLNNVENHRLRDQVFSGSKTSLFRGMEPEQRVDEWKRLHRQHKKQRRTVEDSYRILMDFDDRTRATKNTPGFNKALRQDWNKKRAEYGLPKKPLTRENLREFIDEFEEIRAMDSGLVERSQLDVVRPQDFNEKAWLEGRRGFEAGFELGMGISKRWVSPSRLGSFDKIAKNLRRANAGWHTSAEQVSHAMFNVTRSVAADIGADHEDFLKGINIVAQAVVQGDETQILAKLQLGLTDFEQAGRFVGRDGPTFIDRVADSIGHLNPDGSPLAQAWRRGLEANGIDPKLGVLRSQPGWQSVTDDINGNLDRLRGWLDQARDAITDEGIMPMAPAEILDPLRNDLKLFGDNMIAAILDTEGLSARSKKSLETYWDVLGKQQQKNLELMRRYELAGDSVPLAHIHRVIVGGQLQAVEKILGSAEDPVLGSLVKKLRAAETRKFNSWTVESVNSVLTELRRVANRSDAPAGIGKVIENLIESVPELAERYSTTPHAGVLAELSSLKEIDNAAVAIDSAIALRVKHGESAVAGGEVLATGTNTRIGATGTAFEDAGLDDVLAQRLVDHTERMPEQWVVFRDQKTGREQLAWLTIGGQASESGTGIFVAGKGKTVGAAAAVATNGGGELQMLGNKVSPEMLNSLIGKQIMVGAQPVVANMAANFGYLQKAAPAWARMLYDPIHSILKTGATIVRPDFHLFNMISSVPMLHMNGLAINNIFGGIRDARSFANADDIWQGTAERMALVEGETAGHFGKAARAADRATFRAGGVRGIIQRSRLAGGSPAGITMADRPWYSPGGVAVNPEEIVRVIGEEEMLAGMSSDILSIEQATLKEIAQGEETVGGIMKRLIKDGDFFDSAGKLTKKAKTFLSAVGETPEAMMRLGGMFGFMRQGYTPRQAAQATLRALVDYKDLTPFEQKWMKRAFSFYTFPRKMVPNTLRFIANEPGKFTASTKALFGLPGSETEMGQLALRPEGLSSKLGDYRVNIQRALPQLDVIGQAAWLGDFFLDWRAVSGNPEMKRPPRLAIPLQVLGSAFGEGAGRNQNMLRILQEGFRTSYMTRWALSDQNDPLKTERTVFDGIVGNTFGVRKAEKVVRTRWLVNQYRMVASEIAERLGVEEDPDERADLMEELRRLNATTGRLLQ